MLPQITYVRYSIFYGTSVDSEPIINSSELAPMGVEDSAMFLAEVGEVDNDEFLADLLCWKVVSFPIVYLGLPLRSLG